MSLNVNIGGQELVITQAIWLTAAISLYCLVGWFAAVRKFFNYKWNKNPGTCSEMDDNTALVLISIAYMAAWLPICVLLRIFVPSALFLGKWLSPVVFTKENRS